MSKHIIAESDGYDFSVEQVIADKDRLYQIKTEENSVVLSAWQMMQLFCTLLRMTRNGETI